MPTNTLDRLNPVARVERLPGRGGSFLLLVLPLLAIGVLAWHHRWISDDGWINMRVLQQIAAGNGPVFNAGERVEVGTSTLWLGILAAAQALAPNVEPNVLAIPISIVLMVGAFGLATVAAARLAGTGEHKITALMPLGTVVWAALPPMWDFTTSGLETSLTMFWLALCFHLLVSRLRKPDHQSWGAWRPIWPAIVIGLGWLVRPDAGLFSAFFALALLIQSRRSVSSWLGSLALALPIPLAYQIWRMGYYGRLVPNTALAKDAGANNVAAGWYYLNDFVGLYGVWFPVLIGILVIFDRVKFCFAVRDWGRAAVLALPVIAGLLHAAYIVRVGGDFMHGRFLLPAVFAVMMPVACIGLSSQRRGPAVAVTALVLGWAMAITAGTRPRYDTSIDEVGRNTGRPTLQGVANERAFWLNATPQHRGVTVQDWRGSTPAQAGLVARWNADRDRAFYTESNSSERYESAPGHGVVMSHTNMGITSIYAGPEVTVLDRLALADAVTARTKPAEVTNSAQRTGHAPRDPAWRVARYALPREDDTAHIIDARAAMQCGDLAVLQTAISEPMSWDRWQQNLGLSFRLTFLSFPENPTAARAQLCQWDPPVRY